MWENSGTLGALGRRGSDTAPRPSEPVGLRRDVDAAMVETSRTLRRFLSQRRAQALLVAPAYAVLREAVTDQVGGKLVRPRLTVASYLGPPAATGKSVLSDLRAGRRTELLRLTYLLTDDDGRAVLARHVGNPELDDDGAEEVRRVRLRCGARTT